MQCVHRLHFPLHYRIKQMLQSLRQTSITRFTHKDEIFRVENTQAEFANLIAIKALIPFVYFDKVALCAGISETPVSIQYRGTIMKPVSQIKQNRAFLL